MTPSTFFLTKVFSFHKLVGYQEVFYWGLFIPPPNFSFSFPTVGPQKLGHYSLPCACLSPHAFLP